MSDFRQHADALKALARSYKAVLDAGEFLSAVADLEQVRAEKEAAIRRMESERKEADRRLTDAQEAVAEAERAKEAVERLAAQCRVDAQRDALDLLTQARTDAETIVEEAKVEAQRVRDESAEAIELLANVRLLVNDERAMVKEAEAELAALREQARRLAGG